MESNPHSGAKRSMVLAYWPDNTRAFFQRKRTAEGEDMIFEKNLFIEYILPLRNIQPETINVDLARIDGIDVGARAKHRELVSQHQEFQVLEVA
jgi:hypothetical protein